VQGQEYFTPDLHGSSVLAPRQSASVSGDLCVPRVDTCAHPLSSPHGANVIIHPRSDIRLQVCDDLNTQPYMRRCLKTC
jgi:hypothetical protein